MDARNGHTSYLMFFVVFVNFILIVYNFLIEDSIFFDELISELWIFSIIFLIMYIPVSTLIGRWHTKTQISIEETIKKSEDPILAKMVLTILNVQTGKATDEEIEDFRKLVKKIEKDDFQKYYK